jgi:hypothetical protein
MMLLKPIVIFFVGYMILQYYDTNTEKVEQIPIIGKDLNELAKKNRDMMLLFIVAAASYFI